MDDKKEPEPVVDVYADCGMDVRAEVDPSVLPSQLKEIHEDFRQGLS